MQGNLRAKPTMSRASVPTSALSWAVARASDLKAENREAVFDVLLEDKFAERQQVAAGLREAGAHVAVVWEDHTPVAVCTYTVPSGPPRSGRARRELHVTALQVVKAQRRRKLGPALVRLLEHVAAENSCQEMLVKAAEASRAEGFWKHLGFKRYTGSTDVKSLWAKEGYWAGNDEHGQLLVALGAAVASPADARTNFEAAMTRVKRTAVPEAAAGRRPSGTCLLYTSPSPRD